MGRPPDKFCWDNVDKLPKGRWRCKYCTNEFSGAASRIRIHLSGEKGDISSCEAVPSHIREEALERASKKKQRNSSSREGNDGISAANRPLVDITYANNALEMETALQVSPFNGDLITHSNKGSEEEYTTDVIVKFFISQNLSVDVFKTPHFRNLLTRVAEHGVPSCLHRDDSVGIQKSVSNWEHKVNEYMSMVTKSWKTTGCTLIPYNMNKGRGSPSNVGTESTDATIYGFYCPKGFIFVDGRQLDFSQGFESSFRKHVLSLPMEDVTHELNYSSHGTCEFSGSLRPNTTYGLVEIPCVRQKVEEVWMKICRETGWVHNLIRKSENLYHYMLHSPGLHQCKGWSKLMVAKDVEDAPMSSFTRLRSIMQLEDGIKASRTVSNYFKDEISCVKLRVEEIIKNNEFWCDGKELVDALTPLMKIIDDVDRLLPTTGCLQVEIDKAKRRLKPYYEREAFKYQLIWRSLYFLALDLESGMQGAICAYLNPAYDRRATKDQEVQLDELTEDEADFYLKMDHESLELEDHEVKLDAERKGYRDKNPFAELSSFRHQITHPAELWNKYGGEFPMLRNCAIKMMSQPTCCMCNQVKKIIKHFEGEDNFILRLNYYMMQEFSNLGDRIYWTLYYGDPPGGMRASIPNQISVVDGRHIGQIPAWMNKFITKSTDMIADGNCGYRAIAESLGLGQEKWHEVRQNLHEELNSFFGSEIYDSMLELHGVTVDTISKALNYHGSGNAPQETWLEVTNESTNMGLLVATTFQAIFVVLGPSPTTCCTYLPLYLNLAYPLSYMPEIVICHIPQYFHFTSLSLTRNAPLPPVYHMWFSHRPVTEELLHQISTEEFDDFRRERLNPYLRLAEERQNGEMPPIEMFD